MEINCTQSIQINGMTPFIRSKRPLRPAMTGVTATALHSLHVPRQSFVHLNVFSSRHFLFGCLRVFLVVARINH